MEPGFILELLRVAANGPHPTLNTSQHVPDVNANANSVVEMVM